MILFNLLNMFFLFANDVDFSPVVEQASILTNEYLFIIIGIGIVLIVGTIFILFFLKKIIMNSVLGLIFWAIVVYGFNIQLPLIPSLVVSLVLGPAGIGAMLILNALGLLLI